MIELELLGANGDRLVLTDEEGQRYCTVVDDALRAAVRRARPAALAPVPATPPPGSDLRPRDLQALMRAGASAEEIAATTGLAPEHVQRFEGPVLAERAWAVQQARTCRIGWEKDSPVLGELVVDRLATRGVEPESLEWDAVRQGREPWQITLTFVQGAEVKQARWELDLTARSVSAMDDEARWLTEAGAHHGEVFDQDSRAMRASARSRVEPHAPVEPAEALEPVGTASSSPDSPGSPAGALAPDPAGPGGSQPEVSATEALLADLASTRGQRVEVDPASWEDEEADEQGGSQDGGAVARQGADQGEPPVRQVDSQARAQVVSMSERRRAHTGNHPAGSRLALEQTTGPAVPPPGAAGPAAIPSPDNTPTAPVGQPVTPAPERGDPSRPHTQEALPDMPESRSSRTRRRSRRSVPSWDEIVFGSRPD